LNSAYTDLNSSININADEVRTQNLYVDGIMILPNSVNMNKINCQTLTCQYDMSANTIEAVTSIQGIPVAKFAYLDPTSSIQTQFNSLNTLLTGASWNDQYKFLDLQYNAHIYGALFIGNVTGQINVNDVITNLPNNYALKTALDTTNSNVSALQLLLSGTSWNSTYNILSFANNVQCNAYLWLATFGC